MSIFPFSCATSFVAPYAGAWIEIRLQPPTLNGRSVAPYAGAWIEIAYASALSYPAFSSLPTRERGLKYENFCPGQFDPVSLPTRERGLK